MTAGKVGFRLAPRLNAAGRLGDATTALQLLAAQSRSEALPLALRLNELNQARQEIEATMLAEALAMVPDPPPPAIVLGSPEWHEGVVGIVASRLVDRLYRPTILLTVGDDVAKGSGRSIPGFDLLAAVTACSGGLTRYGGHKAACGLTLPPAEIARFRKAFTAYAASQLGEAELTRRLAIDAVVCGDELTLALADELEQLAPHGFGNPKVTLLLHDAEAQSPRLTRTREHLQCKVRADGVCASAIHFNFKGLDELADGRRYDVPLALGKNAYNGSVKAQGRGAGTAAAGTTCDRRLRHCLLRHLRARRDGPRSLAAARRARRLRACLAFCRRCAAPAGGDRRRRKGGGLAATPRPSRPAAGGARWRGWRPAAGVCCCSSPMSPAAGRCSRVICPCRISKPRVCIWTAPVSGAGWAAPCPAPRGRRLRLLRPSPAAGRRDGEWCGRRRARPGRRRRAHGGGDAAVGRRVRSCGVRRPTVRRSSTRDDRSRHEHGRMAAFRLGSG